MAMTPTRKTERQNTSSSSGGEKGRSTDSKVRNTAARTPEEGPLSERNPGLGGLGKWVDDPYNTSGNLIMPIINLATKSLTLQISIMRKGQS